MSSIVRFPTLVFAFVAAAAPAAVVPISLSSVTVTENFNSLAATGSSSTLPAGWSLLETGGSGNVNGAYAAGTGSSNTVDTYSFGAAASSDRALGSISAGTLAMTIGAAFTNTNASAITSLTISYTGEQWRLGTAARTGTLTDQLDFAFSLDATSLSTGSWNDVNSLDFITPNTLGTVGLRDGNALGNYTAISYTITGLNISNGATFWIRWTDFDATGADDGLAIDDFSITAGTQAQNTPDGLSLAVVTSLFGALLLARRIRCCC